MTDATPLAKKRKKLSLWYWGAVLALTVAALLYWWFVWRLEEYTDDAYVEGNMVMITPLIPGFVQSIHSDDTYLVEKGQLLVEMDATDAHISLEKANERLAQTVRQVCQMFHQVFAYRAEIEMKKAELIKAAQDYEHRKGVIDAGGVSLENFEHAVAALRSSFFSLQMTESLLEKSLSLIQNTSIREHPLVIEAAQLVRDAYVQLYRCKIYSPVRGLVAQRTIQVGMHIDAGVPLMAVIPLDQIWVNANYKETQMKKMRIGQRVKITSDLYGSDVLFHGKVVGLPGGAGNAFSLLPPQNLSGNWIKIVQRLPVRVSLDPDEISKHPLRIGLSLETRVDIREEEGLLVPEGGETSPLYQTNIFALEEQGDLLLTEQIISANLDPTLSEYASEPFLIPMGEDE